MQPRLPIKLDLLEIILFEVDRVMDRHQYYLATMYKALFVMAYYGLFRISELASGDHSIKAKDVHQATNKRKLCSYLYSAKNLMQGSRPQKVKILAQPPSGKSRDKMRCHFCPFELVDNYIRLRGGYRSLDELFFVLRGGIPVQQHMVRTMLAKLLKSLGLNPKVYSFHSMCAGRSTDLYNWGFFGRKN